MANLLSLALKISADATGVREKLTPVERAIRDLDAEAKKVTGVFDQFATASEGASRAQERFATDLSKLQAALQAGQIDGRKFVEEFKDLQAAAKETADAFAEGARITEASRTAEEQRLDTLARLSELLELGAISQETFARASEDSSEAVQDAGRITRANLSPQELYDEQMQELNTHLREGRISQETYNRAMEKASTDLDRAGTSAKETDKSLDSLARNTKILAGIEIGRLFVDGLQSLGNVFRDIAGRVTSLVSSVNDSINTLDDFSQRTGIGVEALQGYALAAKLAGVDTEQFGSAVQKLAVTIGKATPGDALDKSLKAINLSLEQLRALSPDQQFSAIGAAISELPTVAARAAAAVEIFGKQGAALAPLFREGAASIEELQARAKRLGVIISDTQVNNVTAMNDGFDLVLATVNGIIGQVIGDLAPAVTAVTDQFLEFVETFEGTGVNQGGTGIANAITDTLLDGALFFARIFDSFIENIDSLGITFADAGSTFNSGASAFTAVSEGLRFLINLFEILGNSLLDRIGLILETVGGFVSGDLEQVGRDLQTAAADSLKQNVREASDALKNAQAAFDDVFTGVGAGAGAAGEGAGEDFLKKMIAKIENSRKPEVRLELDLAETEKRLKKFLADAGIESSKFLNQSVATVDAFQANLKAQKQTTDSLGVMVRFNKDLNVELEKAEALRRSEKEAAEAQAEAQEKRIEALLGASAATVKAEQELRDLSAARADNLLKLAAATRLNNAEEQAAASSRLTQIDALETSLKSQQQALRQGFSSGFDQAFESVDASIKQLIERSAEFGAAGKAAAQQLEEGIARAQDLTERGFYTKDQYAEEVQRVKDLYAEQVKAMEDLANERKEVNDFVDEQLALNAFGGDSQRLESARRVLEIEEEMGRVQEEIKAARKAGENEAASAAAARLGQLDQVAAKERDIVSGRAAYEEQQQKMRDEALQAQQKAQEAQQAEQKRIFDEQRKAAEAESKRQEERLRALNTLGQQTIASQDVRTTEGANLVLQLSASGQDPGLIQQRLQTKYLEEMNTNLRQAALNYFNSPVAIIGGPPILRPR